MSKLDLLLEAERRGILPDDKKELLAEARRRGLVPGGEGQLEAEPISAGERYLRLANSYIPGVERGIAALRAGAEHIMAPSDDRTAFSERYSRQLERERARNDAAQADPDIVGGTLARTAGLGLTAAGTGGISLLRSALPATATLPQVMKEGARISAGIGAPAALANTRETDPVKQAGDVLEGTIGSAAIGAGVPLTLSAIGLAAGRLRPGAASRQRAAAVRQDFEEANVPILAPALSDSGTVTRTGQGLAGSITGGPVREQAQEAIRGAERGVREAIAGPGVRQRSEFGGEQQDLLRRNLRGYSRSEAELDALTPAELEAVRGAAGYNPTETYPTQFGARYRLAEQEPVSGYGRAADVRGNFVDRFPDARTTQGAVARPTATWNLLNDLGRDARAAGRLKGWKDGDFESPAFWDVMRSHFGDDLANLLKSEHGRAELLQANLTVPGLRDIRTSVRRALQDAQSGQPQAGKVGDIAALQRLHGAMSDDLQRFLNSSGGSNAALRYLVTDNAYRHWIEDVREPLRRIFGDKVSPDEAFNRLWQATQRDTQDIRLLAAYYRVLGDKGTRGGENMATRALLSPMMEGGLQGFLNSYANIAPEARAILFRRSPELQQQLDRLARVSERLAPYQRAVERGGSIDFSRVSNLALAAGLLYHIPNTVMAAGGAHLLARFMASPRFVRWLSEVPQRGARGLNTPAFQAHLARLNTLAADDAEIGEAVLQAVGSALRPESAQAATTKRNASPEYNVEADDLPIRSLRNDEQQRAVDRLRQQDPDSRFNDYLAERSYEAMGDPFMHYYNTIDGRQWFRREQQPLDEETRAHLNRYMDVRRDLNRRGTPPLTPKRAQSFPEVEELVRRIRKTGFDMDAFGNEPAIDVLQRGVDALWKKAPTDENAELIDGLAKQLGIRPPWGRRPPGMMKLGMKTDDRESQNIEDRRDGQDPANNPTEEAVRIARQGVGDGVFKTWDRTANMLENNAFPVGQAQQYVEGLWGPLDRYRRLRRGEANDDLLPGPRNLGGPKPDDTNPYEPGIDLEEGLNRHDADLRRKAERAGEVELPSGSLIGAVKDVYKSARTLMSPEGQYRPGEQDAEGAVKGFEAAGAAMTGGIALNAIKGIERTAVGVFAGRLGARGLAARGRPAALKALDMAEEMEARGATPGEIRAATNKLIETADPALGGVHKGADGQWRVELDDSGARFRNAGPADSKLGKELQHPELYAAYPQAEQNRLMRVSGRGGAYHPGVPEYGIPPEVTVGQNAPSRRSVVLHETQHDLQNREGFAAGGNPEEFKSGAPMARLRKPTESSTGAYERLAGEVEARNVQARADLSPEQRRAIHPDETQAVGTDQQIVRRDPNGPQHASPLSAATTEEGRARIRQMHAEGLSAIDMVKELGVSRSVIYKVLKEEGLAVSDKFAPKMTPEKKQLLARLVREGVPYKDIAPRLGLADADYVTQAVLRYRDELDLPGRNPRLQRANTASALVRRNKEIVEAYRSGGVSSNDLGQQYGMHGSNVRLIVKKAAGKALTTEEARAAIADLAEGASMADLQRRFATTRAEIVKAIRREHQTARPGAQAAIRRDTETSDMPPADVRARNVMASRRQEATRTVKQLSDAGQTTGEIIAAVKQKHGIDLSADDVKGMIGVRRLYAGGMPASAPDGQADEPHYSRRQPRDDGGRFSGPPKKVRQRRSLNRASSLADIGLAAQP